MIGHDSKSKDDKLPGYIAICCFSDHPKRLRIEIPALNVTLNRYYRGGGSGDKAALHVPQPCDNVWSLVISQRSCLDLTASILTVMRWWYFSDMVM